MFRFVRNDYEKTPKVKPLLTYGLILFCALVFLAEAYGSTAYGKDWSASMFKELGFSWAGVAQGKVWTLVTSLFLHATPSHLVLNMIALFFFGHIVEQCLGRKKLLTVFFVSGFAGEAAMVLAAWLGMVSATVPTVGASAAVFGLMATAMIVKPFEMIEYPYLIPLPLVVVAVVYTFYNAAAFLSVIGAGAATDVAYASHFGGLAAGAYFGLRSESKKHDLMVLALVVALLVAIPLVWDLVKTLEIFSYVSIFKGA